MFFLPMDDSPDIDVFIFVATFADVGQGRGTVMHLQGGHIGALKMTGFFIIPGAAVITVRVNRVLVIIVINSCSRVIDFWLEFVHAKILNFEGIVHISKVELSVRSNVEIVGDLEIPVTFFRAFSSSKLGQSLVINQECTLRLSCGHHQYYWSHL